MATRIIIEFPTCQTSDIGELGAIIIEFVPVFAVNLSVVSVYRQYPVFSEEADKN
jgi:hypothetical protein